MLNLFRNVILTIPISENIIEITMKEENALLENNNQNMNLKIVVFIFLTIATVYLLIKILFNKNNDKAILKAYQDLIITIQNEPNILTNNKIYLTNLKDLIGIAINNNSNIFNYQNTYYTFIDNIFYIYNY